MSSPEVEKFEVTDDDLQNEFNPYRRQFRQTKNKATYGIWAHDSDDEADARPSFSSGKGSSSNYGSGINFISGGFKQSSKLPVDSEMLEKGPKDDRFSDSDEDEPPPPPKIVKNTKKGFAARHQSADNIGGWEKHTRGIGARLLEKMGHVKGQGLGKDQQGIATPVEAKLRKGKAAIGFYGSERVPSKLPQAKVQEDSEEEEEKQFQAQLQQWKKGESKARKPKYKYKTADELLSSKKVAKRGRRAEANKLSNVKVIDMTGKEQRVMSGYHALGVRHDRPDEDEVKTTSVGVGAAGLPGAPDVAKQVFEASELLHNLDLLVNMAEDEIINNKRSIEHETDMEVNLKHEVNKLRDICIREEDEIERANAVFEKIKDCERRMNQDSMDALGIEECLEIFQDLKNNYPKEYRFYNLSGLALTSAVPLFQRELEGWRPLTNRRLCLNWMTEWRFLLDDTTQRNHSSSGKAGSMEMNPYDRLVWDVLMPHIRKALQTWNVKDCNNIVDFLDTWQPLLPAWIIENITTQLIMPHLQRGVDEWDPTKDTIPIHSWIHPWLPFMGKRLDPLYSPIRHKLATALRSWHPSDPSAKMILEPWTDVFGTEHMYGFICANILPKLKVVLANFVINPHKQELDAWNWVTTWQDLLPQAAMVELLLQHFFPKWLQVLSTWLNNKPVIEEVTNWYKGWKSIIPENVLSEQKIKVEFNKALQIMEYAVSGTIPPGTTSYLTSQDRYKDSPQRRSDTPPLQPLAPIAKRSSAPVTLKEMLSRKAEALNIPFLPAANKTWEAKQIYLFGNSQIVIDRTVIFVRTPKNEWLPTSMGFLLEQACRQR